jgi:hypothetical protein
MIKSAMKNYEENDKCSKWEVYSPETQIILTRSDCHTNMLTATILENEITIPSLSQHTGDKLLKENMGSIFSRSYLSYQARLQQADCTKLGNELTIPCLSQRPRRYDVTIFWTSATTTIDVTPCIAHISLKKYPIGLQVAEMESPEI